MKKVSVISLVLLSSISLTACGNQSSSLNQQVPLRMTTVSLDSSACVVRPTTKLQGSLETDTNSQSTVTQNKPVATTPVLTPVKSTATLKTSAKTETAKEELDFGNLPVVKAPSTPDSKASVSQPEEKNKTKVGQLIEKVKNVFKKKN